MVAALESLAEGFRQVEPGRAILAIHRNRTDEVTATAAFLATGIKEGLPAVAVHAPERLTDIDAALKRLDLSPGGLRLAGRLYGWTPEDLGGTTGGWKASDVLRRLRSIAGKGQRGTRISLGEPVSLRNGPGASRMFQELAQAYEAFATRGLTIMANVVEPEHCRCTLLEALRIHPWVLLDRRMVRNTQAMPLARFVRHGSFEQVLARSLDALRKKNDTEEQGLDLTPREIEVLSLVAAGRSNREIAQDLQISPKTADTHRTNLMRKIDVHNVAGLVRFAVAHGIVEEP